MSFLSSFYHDFQNKNPEKFNKDIIYARRNEQDSVKDYFEDFFNSLKHDGLTYVGCELIRDESEFHKYVENEFKDIDSQDSRMDLIVAKFLVKANENEPLEEVEFKLFFPKLIDNFYFKLSGNKYYAVYQLTDRNFYYNANSSNEGLYLKTLLMPLGIIPKSSLIKNTHDDSIRFNEFLLDIFKSNTASTKTAAKNFFLHYFIKFGVKNSIDMIFNKDIEKPLVYYIKEDHFDNANLHEDYKAIMFNKNMYVIYYDNGNMSRTYMDMVGTLVLALQNVKRFDYIENIDYWKRKISNVTNGSLAKANRAILSLERILEDRTKRNLKECHLEENKEDVYKFIQWMIWNFYNLRNIDDVNIYNRRLRLFEYLFFPLLRKTSKVSYRILNSRSLDNKRIKSLFSNTHPMYMIKSTLINDLIRYSNSTSNLTLFSSLKWSIKGLQTVGGEGGVVNMRFMDVHPTYLGNVGLNSANASEPGATGTLCPMNDHFDKMFFEDKNQPPKHTMYIHSIEEAFFN